MRPSCCRHLVADLKRGTTVPVPRGTRRTGPPDVPAGPSRVFPRRQLAQITKAVLFPALPLNFAVHEDVAAPAGAAVPVLLDG